MPTLFAEASIASDAIMKAFYALVMIIVLFLPFMAIPYIFIKMGSVAGKVQGSFNRMGRGLRKSATGAVRKQGKAAAGRAWQNKSAQWAGRDKDGLLKRVGGFKAQRDFRNKTQLDNAERAQRRAIMGRIGTDSAYVRSAAGVEGDRGVARIRAMATEAAIKERSAEVDAHSLNLTRNASIAAASGIRRNSTGQLTDVGGSVLSAASIKSMSGLDTSIGTTGAPEFDLSTMESLKYISDNNLTSSVSGVRAIGSTLASTGALDTNHVERLATDLNATQVDKSEVAYTVDFLNDKASSAGLKHLQYNSVASDGSLNLGGNMGGPNGVVNRIMQDGVSRITKEMYADNRFGKMIAQKVHDLELSNPDTFSAELAKMNPRQIENLIAAKVKAGIIPVAQQSVAIQSMTQQQAEAVKRYGITN